MDQFLSKADSSEGHGVSMIRDMTIQCGRRKEEHFVKMLISFSLGIGCPDRAGQDVHIDNYQKHLAVVWEPEETDTELEEIDTELEESDTEVEKAKYTWQLHCKSVLHPFDPMCD